MKHIILASFVIGFGLTLASLIKVTGQVPPMSPCEGIGHGCIAGVAVNLPQSGVTGHRGYPLSVLYLQTDEDGNSVYDGYSAAGIVGDLAIYSLISFGILMAAKRLQHSPKVSN